MAQRAVPGDPKPAGREGRQLPERRRPCVRRGGQEPGDGIRAAEPELLQGEVTRGVSFQLAIGRLCGRAYGRWFSWELDRSQVIEEYVRPQSRPNACWKLT